MNYASIPQVERLVVGWLKEVTQSADPTVLLAKASEYPNYTNYLAMARDKQLKVKIGDLKQAIANVKSRLRLDLAN